MKRRAVELYRQKKQAKLWHDYGPTLAAEELAEQHGIQVSRETLRQWLIEAKLWRRRRARIEQAREKLYLIAMIDDATSHLTAHFVRHDSTEENLRQLRHYIEQHGRPVAVYTDKASLFQIAPRAIHQSRCSAAAAEPDRTRPQGAQHRMDRGPFAASQGAH